jgi:hypothetical protein
MLKNNMKLTLDYYHKLKRRNNQACSFFIPFSLKYRFAQKKLKFSFNNFILSNRLSFLAKTFLSAKRRAKYNFVSVLCKMYFLNNSFLKNTGANLNLKQVFSSNLSKYSININYFKSSKLKTIKILNLNHKFICSNLNLSPSYKSSFNFNVFKMSRFALSNCFFNNTSFFIQQNSLPYFLHRQLAIDKFRLVLSNYFTQSIKLKKSSKQ